jgi:two-component system response regulator AtoC
LRLGVVVVLDRLDDLHPREEAIELGSQISSTIGGTKAGAAAGSNGFNYENSVSPGAQAMERTIALVAPTNIPVLLVGESGTGKRLVAQQIHHLSSQREQPLVTMICNSLVRESLVACFGQGKGDQDATGLNRPGTLFLEEISELDPANQRNLLYTLPDEDKNHAASIAGPRLISATTRNLEEEVRAGRFRSELYYRINGACLRLLALRERKEDILAFGEFFLMKHSTLLGRPRPHLDAQDRLAINEYSWPGNIRELENVMKRIVVLGDAKAVLLELKAAPMETRSSQAGAKKSVLKSAARAASFRAERELILEVLARTRWNRKRAAQELQVSYKSLLYKLKQIKSEELKAV